MFSGATFEAVEEVGSTIERFDEMGIDLLEGLSSLVNKSLVQQAEQSDGESRLLLLETIQEFAAARLEELPEWNAAARRSHATYFAEWTQRQRERLTSDGGGTGSEPMVTELENIRTAWRYWLAQGNLEQLGKIADSLWLLCDGRGWYHETISLTTDLLKVLSSTPSTPERVLEQITLQTSLARALLALKGFTQEAEEAYTRALELCERVGEIPQLLPVLRGLSTFYMYRAEFEKGARIGEQILALAERSDATGERVLGHMLMGANLTFLGNLSLGMEHLEKGISAYDLERHGSYRFRLGNNPVVVCLTMSALLLWMLGFPDRALNRANQAIALSKKLNHPSSMAYALFHTGLLHLWRREVETAHRCAQAVLDIVEEHEFQSWRAVGFCLRGVALAGMGSAEEGLTLIQQGINMYQRLKTPPVFWPMLLFLQAGTCGLANRPADGLNLLNEAMGIEGQGSGNPLSSEFFQLKGDLLLALSRDNLVEVESCYQDAVNLAMQTPMMQLRAAVKLGRLWREQGKTEAARKLLSDVLERFTEGFTIADLIEAKALLDDLVLG